MVRRKRVGVVPIQDLIDEPPHITPDDELFEKYCKEIDEGIKKSKELLK